MKTQLIDRRRAERINWETVITMIVFHVGALAALFMFTWTALIVSLVILWVAGSLGIGMGYHRLLTHRGFKTPKWVEYVLTVCATLTLESGPLQWVTTHRIHHAHTDVPDDPHSPLDGTWWAHMGWILKGTAQKHDRATMERYSPDLLRDGFQVWISRWYFLPLVLLGIGLLAFGGWSVFFWGIFLRTVFGLHATWLVNSATHMWGTRRFETTDDSTNNLLIALLTFGEGWHNNHHAHPASARHGLAWYEIDVNWWGIRTLQLLGLAKSVKLVGINGLRAGGRDEKPAGVLRKAA
ncbi:MAG TPA: fatty acid desaturase [Pyrinomonadaceae bacterium]|jgi:stearoyl-CoA desaturase (delta-9 desaturase)|nr:fatty acid desaturase [Pyrinomonadaceae bacterium]